MLKQKPKECLRMLRNSRSQSSRSLPVPFRPLRYFLILNTFLCQFSSLRVLSLFFCLRVVEFHSRFRRIEKLNKEDRKIKKEEVEFYNYIMYLTTTTKTQQQQQYINLNKQSS
jgi:hypothetical protein